MWVVSASSESWDKAYDDRGLTKGVRYWKLLVSSKFFSSRVFRSFKTNAISMTRTAPAAMRVYPNTVCTWVLSSSDCGWALMPQPVKMMTKAGNKFRFGRPSLFLLRYTPNSPAHHHTTPMLVCWMSFLTQGPPQRCSVKVLTQPQAAMSSESKNSWLRPDRLSQYCPTRSKIVKMIP